MIKSEKMKKVGILTFHRGPNHGAFLQAYAMTKVVAALGHDARIIDYKNRAHRRIEGWRQVLVFKRPIRFIDYFRKKMAFEKALSHFASTNFTTEPDEVRKQNFDVVSVGSDVVWDYNNFGYDDLYFGNLGTARKISYAASFGCVGEDDRHPPGIGRDLERFDKVSVRDVNSANIFNRITGRQAAVVLDPTMICDFDSETVRCKRRRPYLLVYLSINDARYGDVVKSYAKENNLRTIAVGYRQFWCDEVRMGLTPFEWIGYFRQASAVATNTYHGLVFSVKNRKRCFFFKSDKTYNRASSLAMMLGLDPAFQVDNDDFLFLTPDYSELEKRMEPIVKRSISWLKSALQDSSPKAGEDIARPVSSS